MGNRNFNQFSGDYQPHQVARKKSRGLAILFGLIPGAGHMYLGKMNRGLTLMAIFWGDVGVAVLLPPVLFLLPIIWFYSFFDALNLASLSQQELREAPDEIGIFTDSFKKKGISKPIANKGKWFGWAMMLVGGYLLYEMLNSYLIYFLQNITGYDFYWLREIFRAIPRAVMAVLVVGLGFRLVKGGKKSDAAEDVRPYHGDYSGLNNSGSGHYHSDGSYHAPAAEQAQPQTASAYTEQAASYPREPEVAERQPVAPQVPVAEPELTIEVQPEEPIVVPELTLSETEPTIVEPELTIAEPQAAPEKMQMNMTLPKEEQKADVPKVELIAFMEDEEEIYETK